jgi:hypothetical protein
MYVQYTVLVLKGKSGLWSLTLFTKISASGLQRSGFKRYRKVKTQFWAKYSSRARAYLRACAPVYQFSCSCSSFEGIFCWGQIVFFSLPARGLSENMSDQQQTCLVDPLYFVPKIFRLSDTVSACYERAAFACVQPFVTLNSILLKESNSNTHYFSNIVMKIVNFTHTKKWRPFVYLTINLEN